MSIIRIEDATIFEGRTVGEATALIESQGYEVRIVWADGHTIHADYIPDYDPLRCNLSVKAAIVIKAVVG
jgi:hypothetical protein